MLRCAQSIGPTDHGQPRTASMRVSNITPTRRDSETSPTPREGEISARPANAGIPLGRFVGLDAATHQEAGPAQIALGGLRGWLRSRRLVALAACGQTETGSVPRVSRRPGLGSFAPFALTDCAVGFVRAFPVAGRRGWVRSAHFALAVFGSASHRRLSPLVCALRTPPGRPSILEDHRKSE